MTVRHCLLALVALAGLLFPMRITAEAVGGLRSQGPVYSVAAIQAHLARNPSTWLGLTVLVQGRAEVCYDLYCASRQPHFSNPDAGAMSEPLVLTWADPQPALVFLRRMPLLGSLLPPPQVVDWGAVGTYRVTLRVGAEKVCGGATCYEAVALDAAP